MSANSPGDISQLLEAWSAGDRSAFNRLTPLVYEELRQIANRHMAREEPDHTLQATALVNEAYFKLVDSTRMQWRDRAHFFAMSSQLMRRILIDYARRNNAKRGANLKRISLDDRAVLAGDFSEQFLELDDALSRLAMSTSARPGSSRCGSSAD